jgi:hypothetical protein
MSLGTGTNKEQYLMFLTGYLLIFTVLVSFVVTTINNGLVVQSMQVFTTANPLSLGGFFASMGNMFVSLLNPFYILPDAVMPIYIQIFFIKLPQYGIAIILLSYIKDMIP